MHTERFHAMVARLLACLTSCLILTGRAIAIDVSFKQPETVANIADSIQLGQPISIRCEAGAGDRRLPFEAHSMDIGEVMAKLAREADLELVTDSRMRTTKFILRVRKSSAGPASPGAADRIPIAAVAASPASALIPTASAISAGTIPLEIRLLVGPGAVPTPLWVVKSRIVPGRKVVLHTSDGTAYPGRTDGVSLVRAELDLKARVAGSDRVRVRAQLDATIRLDGEDATEHLTGVGTCVRGTALLMVSHARPPGRLVQLELQLVGPLP